LSAAIPKYQTGVEEFQNKVGGKGNTALGLHKEAGCWASWGKGGRENRQFTREKRYRLLSPGKERRKDGRELERGNSNNAAQPYDSHEGE